MEDFKVYKTYHVSLFDSAAGTVKKFSGAYYEAGTDYPTVFLPVAVRSKFTFAIGESKKEAQLFAYDTKKKLLHEGPKNVKGKKAFSWFYHMDGAFFWIYGNVAYIRFWGDDATHAFRAGMNFSCKYCGSGCFVLENSGTQFQFFMPEQKKFFPLVNGELGNVYSGSCTYCRGGLCYLYSFADGQSTCLGKEYATKSLDADGRKSFYYVHFNGREYVFSYLCFLGQEVVVKKLLYQELIMPLCDETLPLGLCADGCYRFPVFQQRGKQCKWQKNRRSRIFFWDDGAQGYKLVYDGADAGRFFDAAVVFDEAGAKMLKLSLNEPPEVVAEGEELHEICCLACSSRYAQGTIAAYLERKRRKQEKEQRKNTKPFWKKLLRL